MSRRRASACRSVGYGWTTELDFNELPLETLLEQEKRAGLVVEYDTGRGYTLWLDGRPGKDMRELCQRIEKMLEPFKPTRRRRG